MWEQKRKRPDFNNGGGTFAQKRKIPEFKGTDEIDAVLAEAEEADREEERELEQDDDDPDYCGC